VKTKLKKRYLEGALENISAAKKVPHMRTTPGIIFAFQSSKAETIVRYLREYKTKLPVEYYPVAILLLDEGAIIHRWLPSSNEVTDVYQIRKGKKNEEAVVMAFLMLSFFDVVMGNLYGGSDVVNMIIRMLEYRTYQVGEDFKIGENN
jgi:hypothetical protein